MWEHGSAQPNVQSQRCGTSVGVARFECVFVDATARFYGAGRSVNTPRRVSRPREGQVPPPRVLVDLRADALSCGEVQRDAPAFQLQAQLQALQKLELLVLRQAATLAELTQDVVGFMPGVPVELMRDAVRQLFEKCGDKSQRLASARGGGHTSEARRQGLLKTPDATRARTSPCVQPTPRSRWNSCMYFLTMAAVDIALRHTCPFSPGARPAHAWSRA